MANKVGGRKAGTPNKIGAALKDHVWQAFIKLEGAAGMVKWANKCNANMTEFYRICSKIIPVESHHSMDVTKRDVRELTNDQLLEIASAAMVKPAEEVEQTVQ